MSTSTSRTRSSPRTSRKSSTACSTSWRGSCVRQSSIAMPRDPSDAASNRKMGGEEALIAEFWAPLAAGFPGAFGLQDDCAVIAPPAGSELVITTDAVIAGVHFFPDAEPGAIAWKALAVNVSDLVAKGAEPLAYLMNV